jgi:hypothetical protein
MLLTHTKHLNEVFALLIRQQLDQFYHRRRASRGSRVTIPSSHLLKVGGQQGHLVEFFFIRATEVTSTRADINQQTAALAVTKIYMIVMMLISPSPSAL